MLNSASLLQKKALGFFQTGLLINVIRSLTTSVSEDQRELEKSRLQKGFQESEALIDKLVKCMFAFSSSTILFFLRCSCITLPYWLEKIK